jgi:hypothetical protein
MTSIISAIDKYLERTGRQSIGPVEANKILAKAGLLRDSKDRPGKPLRDLLRKGQLPHAFQSGGKGTEWTIPHSSKPIKTSSNYPATTIKKTKTVKPIIQNSKPVDTVQLKKQLEKARQKYKPQAIKYLLIAEAPPDSLDRFFYYDNVKQHDYLFLGVAQALYPDLKDQFILSGRNSDIKNSILQKLQADGFYLLDLSELPLSLMTGDLSSQLSTLVSKLKNAANTNTKIILIKATVYDTAFTYLQDTGFRNVINVRIPFPGQGGQILFQQKFKEALKLSGHSK